MGSQRDAKHGATRCVFYPVLDDQFTSRLIEFVPSAGIGMKNLDRTLMSEI